MAEVSSCPACGTARQPGDVRCRRCGRDLYATVALPPPPVAPAARRRVPVHPLAVIGGLAIVASAFLPWISANGSQGGSEVPLAILWDLNAAPVGLKLGTVLVALGASALALSFVPRTSIARRVLGGLAMVVAVAFAVQVFRAIGQLGGDVGDTFDVLGVAVYVTLAGGVLLLSSR